MKYYKIIDEPIGIPIPWKNLPPAIKTSIPGEYLWNMTTVDKYGILGEITAASLIEVDEDCYDEDLRNGGEFEGILFENLNEETVIVLDLIEYEDDFC